MKELIFNYTISYFINEKDIKERLLLDKMEEHEITDEVLIEEGENITRKWLNEAIEECQIDSSEEYFACEPIITGENETENN